MEIDINIHQQTIPYRVPKEPSSALFLQAQLCVQILWQQLQHLVDLEVQILSQAQHFVSRKSNVQFSAIYS